MTNKFNTNIFNPGWVAGFIDGEGTLHVAINKNSTMALGYQVQLQFAITQHIRDELMMLKFIDFFGGGTIVNDGPLKVQYRIRSFKLLENLFDLLGKYPLQTQKRLDAECFRQVYDMMVDRKHLTSEGLEVIRSIKSTMNRSRKAEYK
jgi:hypothetical protein